MARGSITYHNGKEFVDVLEFARRMNVSKTAVEKKISFNIIPTMRFDGKVKRYIDWELGSMAYKMKSKMPFMKADSFTNAESKVGPLKVSSPTVAPLDEEKEHKAGFVTDLKNLDQNILEDCTVDGMTDWDLAKKKIAALTYAHDLDVKKGKYVEKAEIQRWVVGLSKIIDNALASIPNRYSAVLVAKLSEFTLKRFKKSLELTDKEKTELRNLMSQIGPDIMLSIQGMIDDWRPENDG